MRQHRFGRVVWWIMGLALVAGVTAVPGGAGAVGYPFRDPRLPLRVRVDDLLGRLTLAERIAMLHQYQPAVPRLGIGVFKAGTEALHGVAWSNDYHHGGNQVYADGTVFPQAVGLASSWDPTLVRQVGTAVGDEARGFHAENPDLWGLNLWAPVTNLLRDPRWGRNEEGYSEDPTLTGSISTAYGRGLEGDDPRSLLTAPTLKHYLAYNNETGRDVTSSTVPPRVLNEYDRQAFEAALKANAATGVMASYNLVNGRPDTVDEDLAGLERSWSDQTLFNVTDAYAPYNLTGSEHYYATQPEADAAVLKAGLDSFTVDNTDGGPTVAAVTAALRQGLLTGADVDNAVRHALTIRFRLGEFDPGGGRYGTITPAVINSPAHQELNRRAADEGMVLLNNAKSTLPLDPARTRDVAVVGPLSDTLFSDWYGGTMPYQVTPVDGIRQRLGAGATVAAVPGVDRVGWQDVTTGRYLTATGTGGNDAVVASDTAPTPASEFDVTDWTGGVSTLRNAANGHYLTGNFGPYNTSSTTPSGWYVQQQFRTEPQPDGTYLIRYAGYETNETWWPFTGNYVTVAADGTVGTGTLAQAAHYRRDVVTSGTATAVAAARHADAAVVVVGSNPFVYGRENHDRTSTALGAGQQALIAAVQKANPRTVVVLEDSYPTTMDVHPDSLLWTTHAGAETGHAVADVLFGDVDPTGRLTQTWYRSDADLPPDLNDYDIITSGQTYQYFHGTPRYPFGYGLSYTTFRYGAMSAALSKDGRTVRVSVPVTNTGSRAGTEVVQLYSHQRTSRDPEPARTLRAFQRVTLDPGRTATARFTVPVSDLAHWDVTRGRWVVETSAYDLEVGASATDVRQRATVAVHGETIPPRDLATTTRAENFDTYSAGVTLADETRAAGTAVASASSQAGWVGFRRAGLGRGATTVTARVADPGATPGTIQVRLDSPTGPLAGTVAVPTTGDVYAYTTATAPLTGAGGLHDVYLVLSPGIRLSTFTLR
jgi:beta-glucosidase